MASSPLVSLSLLFVLFSSFFLLNLVSDVVGSCSSLTCADCFKEAGCGWCSTSAVCLPGNGDGPSDYTKCAPMTLPIRPENWYFSKSQVLSKTSGFPVNPSITNVYLRPNEALDITVDVTVPLPGDQDLDLMFVQDNSGSMADDLVKFRLLATSLMNALLTVSRNPRVGLASFIEKPCEAQGYGPCHFVRGRAVDPISGYAPCYYLDSDNTIRNYAYRLEQNLTVSVLQLQNALYRLTATGNRDFPEAATEALGQVLTCGNIGWNEKARKVVVVVSDAKTHSHGGQFESQSCTRNSPVWDGTCYGLEANVKYGPVDNDYPSLDQIADLFRKRNIVPIFAIAHNPDDSSTDSPSTSELTFWKNFLTSITFGAAAELDTDSDNLVSLVVQALNDVSSSIRLVNSANHPVVTSIRRSDGVFLGTDKQNLYSSVPPGETRTFVVTLRADAPRDGDSITLTALGFGTSEIRITTNFPCTDCAGTPNGNAKWDKCNICNGQNSCVGCDGIPNSNQVLDQCGKCGGNGICSGACPGKVDKCGVCDGKDFCVGCDGVPFSQAVTDDCGVCNGNNDCRGCDGKLYNSSNIAQKPTLDRCGVCTAPDAADRNFCVGCDGKIYDSATSVPPKNDQCGVCGGTDDCLNCPNPGWTRDKCKVCRAPNDPERDACPEAGACGVPGAPPCDTCDGLKDGPRRDVCGVCGGNGTSCILGESDLTGSGLQARNDLVLKQRARNIGIIVGVVVGVLVIAIVATVAFFLYKKHKNPHWMIPKAMLEGINDGVAENPLYKPTATWQVNRLN